MGTIKFTQYLQPNGRKNDIYIERPDNVADKASAIIEAGYAFEAEILSTGEVSLSIHDTKLEEDVAGEICVNGPEVISAVDKLVTEFYKGFKK